MVIVVYDHALPVGGCLDFPFKEVHSQWPAEGPVEEPAHTILLSRSRGYLEPVLDMLLAGNALATPTP